MYYNHNKWDRNEIMDYSDKCFRNILKYAYKNSTFYRRYYTNYGIKFEHLDTIDPKDIPYMDKEKVRNNFFDIPTLKIKKRYLNDALKRNELLLKVGNYYLVHTSGSTGRPCSFLYGKRALNKIESNFVRLSIGGKNSIRMTDFPIRTLYIASVGSGYACTALALEGIKKYKSRSVVVSALEPLEKWQRIVGDFKPNYIGGYPSCIKIAAHLQEEGKIKLRPKKIITGGEPLTKETSKYFSELFNADIIDYYGCTESIIIGAGASYYDGMYLFDDMNYIEVDKDNKLVITPFYNNTFPLIRYRLNDIVEDFNYDGEGVLPYTHINRIIGREEEVMWFKNSSGNFDFLHPLFLDDIDVKGIKYYQFIQKSDTFFSLKCVKFSNSDEEELIKNLKGLLDNFLKKKNMENVKYDISFEKSLDINPHTGKTNMVIKKLK